MAVPIKPLHLIILIGLCGLIGACAPLASESSPIPFPATPTGQLVPTQAVASPSVPVATNTSTAPPSTESALSMPPIPTALPPVEPTIPPLSYLPADLPVISPENAEQLYQVAWLAEDRLTGVAWSSDGNWMGAISLKGVTIYETAVLPPACYGEGCEEFSPTGHFVPAENPDPIGVFLSPDGETLGVLRVNDFAVDLYDVASGQLTRRLEWLEHASPVLYGVAFSPDWSTLAWYTRGSLLLMDVASGEAGPMMSTEDFIQAIAFSPDGSLIAAAAGGTVNDEFQPLVQVWQVSDGEPLATLTGYTQVNISGVADLLRFSQDGRYLMAGHSDGSIAVWDIPDGTLRKFIGGLRSNLPVSDIAMSADGESLLATYGNQTATLWDLTKSREPVTWSGRLAGISPDAGMVALLRPDGRGALIEAATGEQMADLGVNSYLSSLSFSPDSRYLAALSVEQSTLWLWQVPAAIPLAPLAFSPDLGADVAYAPDGTTIAIAWYGCQARLWDAPSGEILRMLVPADAGCLGGPEAVFSPDGGWLALAAGTEAAGGVTLWDYRTGEEITHLSLEQGFVHSLAFSPDGNLLAAGTAETGASGNVMGGQAVVWDLTSEKVVHAFPHDNWVTAVAFSPDGGSLASGTAALSTTLVVSGGLINLWDLESEELVYATQDSGDHVLSLAYSPDGTLLASGSQSGNLVLWEAGSGERLAILGAHNASVVDVAFSPDGRLLAAAILTDGASTVEIWEVASEELLAQLEGESLAFSPDGTNLASTVFNSVRLWGVSP